MSRMPLAIILLLAASATAMAQPCNPVLDGTYCAEEANRMSNLSISPTRLAPIRNMADDIAIGSDLPGTLGALTFRGNGTRCIGLLRRGRCD